MTEFIFKLTDNTGVITSVKVRANEKSDAFIYMKTHYPNEDYELISYGN